MKQGPAPVQHLMPMTISSQTPQPVRQGKAPLTFHWRVESVEVGLSLAAFLSRKLPTPREEAADLIDFGSVQVDGRQERSPSRSLRLRQEITVHLPWLGVRRHYEIDPQRILYADPFVMAYNKESGIPSQQTPADAYNNVHAAVLRHQQHHHSHPYVALHHRLDRETSGVLIFALNKSVNTNLGGAFERKEVIKDYLAWVKGCPVEETWEVVEDIGRVSGRYVTCARGTGKAAATAFQVVTREAQRSLVWARPRTGRTHQIRLHLRWCGHPVLGDRLYGGPPAPRLYLHAYRLQLEHPQTHALLKIVAPVPEDWPEGPELMVPWSDPLPLV